MLVATPNSSFDLWAKNAVFSPGSSAAPERGLNRGRAPLSVPDGPCSPAPGTDFRSPPVAGPPGNTQGPWPPEWGGSFFLLLHPSGDLSVPGFPDPDSSGLASGAETNAWLARVAGVGVGVSLELRFPVEPRTTGRPRPGASRETPEEGFTVSSPPRDSRQRR